MTARKVAEFLWSYIKDWIEGNLNVLLSDKKRLVLILFSSIVRDNKLHQETTTKTYSPHNKEWIKEKIYTKKRQPRHILRIIRIGSKKNPLSWECEKYCLYNRDWIKDGSQSHNKDWIKERSKLRKVYDINFCF